MRGISALFAAVAPLIANAQAAARLEQNDMEPRIVATATRTARVAPDRVTLYIAVEGSGETAPEALQRASQKLQAVTAALQPFIAGKDAFLSVPYGVGPAPNMNGFPGASSQASFLARYVIRIQPSRVDQVGQISSAAAAAGASSASPPTFESSAADSVRRLRSAEALTQARRDAEALAAALGGRLGPVIEVTSNSGPNFQANPGYVNFISRFEYGGPMQSPDIVVNATVTVRYRFLPQ